MFLPFDSSGAEQNMKNVWTTTKDKYKGTVPETEVRNLNKNPQIPFHEGNRNAAVWGGGIQIEMS